MYTVEPVYYGHLGTDKKCPDYQGVLIFQVILYDKVQFGTSTKCLDYAGVLIFKCPYYQVSLYIVKMILLATEILQPFKYNGQFSLCGNNIDG